MLLVTFGAPAGVAHAEAPPLSEALHGEAKTSYDAARGLLSRGDYAGAYDKFEAAYAETHDARLLWNMASCQHSMHHPAKTAELLERYLHESGTSLGPHDREAAEAVLNATLPLVATLKLETLPAGARVTIDGVDVGKAPFDRPLHVDAGSHDLEATKDGYHTTKRTVVLAAREIQSVRLELEPARGATLVVRAGSSDFVSIDGQTVGLGTVTTTVGPGQHTIHVAGKEREEDRDRSVVTKADERVVIDLRPPEKKSYAWAWVGGGVVLAAGIGVTAALLLHHSDSPGATSGTVPPGTVQLR